MFTESLRKFSVWQAHKFLEPNLILMLLSSLKTAGQVLFSLLTFDLNPLDPVQQLYTPEIRAENVSATLIQNTRRWSRAYF